MSYKINGITIKNPHDFQVEKYKLTKSGRIASGLMTMDVIAKKKKFKFQYTVISGPDMKKITDILDSDDAFYTFEFEDHEGTHTYTVYPGALPYTRFRTDGVQYFKNFNFDLIEQ